MLQSKYAWADIRRPQPWGTCDRCGFRYMRSELRFQYDWRGTSIQNLRILVDHRCEDVPQPQLRAIIIGPDPYPVMDPRPGFAATEQGNQPPIQTPLEIIEGGGGTVSGAGLGNDGGVLILTSPTTSGYPVDSDTMPDGGLYLLGGSAVGVHGTTTPNIFAPPLYFGFITASGLLTVGGANLPLSGGPPGSLQLWNNGGLVSIS